MRRDIVQVVMLLAIVGLYVVLMVPRSVDSVDVRRVDELTDMLLRVEQERDDLKSEVEQLRSDLSSATGEHGTVSGLERELERAQMAAGFTSVEGPGVVVRLSDGQSEIDPGTDPNRIIVHDHDILRVINELRAAGAEAISINGQRVIATTEIRCVGPVVSVNNVRMSTPITIEAIGDADTLDSALKMRGGIVDMLRLWGVEVSVSPSEELMISGYSGALVFRHAVPVGSS